MASSIYPKLDAITVNTEPVSLVAYPLLEQPQPTPASEPAILDVSTPISASPLVQSYGFYPQLSPQFKDNLANYWLALARNPLETPSRYFPPVPQNRILQDSSAQSYITCLRPSPTSVPSFNPYDVHLATCHVHYTLSYLSARVSELFFQPHLSLAEKITLCERIVPEIVSGAAQDCDPSTPELYAYLELLEVAVRNHLYYHLLVQEYHRVENIFNTNDKFPDDLGHNEALLNDFVTNSIPKEQTLLANRNKYNPPQTSLTTLMMNNPLMFANIIDNTMAMQAKIEIASCEETIRNKLQELQLETPSQFSLHLEFTLRAHFTLKLIEEQAKHFQMKLTEKDVFSISEVTASAEKTARFLSKEGFFDVQENSEIRLLTQIFKLPPHNALAPYNPAPFSVVRERLLEQKDALTNSLDDTLSHAPKPTLLSRLNPLRQKPLNINHCKEFIEAACEKHMATIDEAEKRWHELTGMPLPILQPDDFACSAPTYEELEMDEPFIPLEAFDLQPQTITPAAIPTPPTAVSPTVSPLIDRVIDLTPPVEEKRVYRATDLELPLASYVDLSFADLMKKTDEEIWQALPNTTKRDVLLHCIHLHNCNGKVEGIACRMFNTFEKQEKELPALNRELRTVSRIGLSEEFVQKGEELLDIYYSEERLQNPHVFIQKFRELPKNNLFYYYVYEMAKLAGVEIPSWDFKFAENSWELPGMRKLSVMALERCLHASS